MAHLNRDLSLKRLPAPQLHMSQGSLSAPRITPTKNLRLGEAWFRTKLALQKEYANSPHANKYKEK
eukprot:5328307-Amphidinium_carterae.1